MMRTKLLPILASPCCKAEIRLEGFNNETGDSKVSEGILTCVACQTEYPIINGIPRFVIELSEEEKSALSNIKSQGLVIREQTKNDDVSSEDIYKKIERIIREYEAPHAGKSEYAKQKYGADKVAQIGTFGTMMARGAVRDVDFDCDDVAHPGGALVPEEAARA